MSEDRWTYKGHRCEISDVGDEDCSKAWHDVTTPDGVRLVADITPYDWSRRLVEMWIDAGYPGRELGRFPCGPLQLEDLQRLLAEVEAMTRRRRLARRRVPRDV